MQTLTFKPRVAPRNAADALITISVGLLQVLIMLGVPGMIALAVTRSVSGALLCVLALNVVFVLMAVTRLELTDAGIRLVRILGGPRFIAWDAIERVEEAPRSELIVRGWLWPMFPPREFSASLTSLGHYRIAYGGRCVYFGPKDEAGFMAAVKARLAQRAAAV